MKDLAREHCRLDDPTYDGRRLADAALVPRERRPRRAHPVEAAQQVLVAPRVQVVICAGGKTKGRSAAGSQRQKAELARTRRDVQWRHMYAATTTRCTLIQCARVDGPGPGRDQILGSTQSCAPTRASDATVPRRQGGDVLLEHVGWPCAGTCAFRPVDGAPHACA